MIMRGHRTTRIALASLSELAQMAHEAEETDDDVTTLGIMEELEVRGGASLETFRQQYMQQWSKRHTAPTNRKAMSTPTFTELDFIADQLYRQKCKAENTRGPRWWALREELRDEYRATARARVASWATTESITFQKVHGRPASPQPGEPSHPKS